MMSIYNTSDITSVVTPPPVHMSARENSQASYRPDCKEYHNIKAPKLSSEPSIVEAGLQYKQGEVKQGERQRHRREQQQPHESDKAGEKRRGDDWKGLLGLVVIQTTILSVIVWRSVVEHS